ILVYPATANTLASFAQGRSDSLLGSIFLAHQFKKPFWIAPAMNTAMMEHPATRRNIELLKDFGVEVLQPDSGILACGETGIGRLIEPEVMLERIDRFF